LVGFDVSIAHVDLNQSVCAVRVEALKDLLASYGFEVDIQFCQTWKRAECIIARLVYLKQ